MGRAERLYALVEALRAAGSGGRTAASLADRFEVSVRTVKRDMRTLVDAGAPIRAQDGRGGGYQLARDVPLPPLSFTAAEATAVAVALAGTPELPFRRDGEAALAKVLGAMSPAARRAAEDAAGRVWIRRRDARRRRAVHVVDEGLARGVAVDVVYRGGEGATTRRRIDPLAFARTGGRWYVLAWCHLRRGGRWFRLDRVAEARLTREPVPPRDLRALFGEPPADARPLVLARR